ncbi:MAG: hypothetical protein JWP49_2017 [Phenylobacterium sp.]|jgi:hypothetical protein|nr:hypothetical protein [Phenylobacterium sp.]
MNPKMIALAVFASLALSVGTAAAQMQPIPNPPEKPKMAAKHHKAAKHHAMKAAKAEAKEEAKEEKAEAAPKK